MRTQDRIDKFYQDLRREVREKGHVVMSVFPAEDRPGLPFCYTVGHAPNLPELLVIGPYGSGGLNYLSNIMKERGRAFDENEIVDLGGKLPVKIITADLPAHAEYTEVASQYHGTNSMTCSRSWYLICRFPDHPGCDEPYASAPILGVRRQ